MAEGPLHVVFGAGQVGRALAAHLSGWALPSERCPGANPQRCPKESNGGEPTPAML